MTDEKGYLYRVGWLGTFEQGTVRLIDAGQEDSVERLTILGDYTATSAAAAVKLALDDSENNGGVPGMAGQRMVAVPASRWSEFATTARQRTDWEVTPVAVDPAQIPGQTQIGEPGE